MKSWIKIVLVVGIVTLAGGSAWALGPGGHGRFMKHMVAAKVEEAEELIDATPDQRKVIESARDNIVAKVEAQMQARQEQHGKWLALFTADQFSEQAVDDAIDAHAAAIKQVAHEIVPEVARVHDALTPAQRQKLADHFKEMHGHHGHGGFGGHE
jgi:Spy/CpxP family protein refolding chaperone